MDLTRDVWERGNTFHSNDELSKSSFTFSLMCFTLFGLILAGVCGYACRGWTPGILEVLFVGLGIPIIGQSIAFKNDHWGSSLLGYLLVACPMGCLGGAIIGHYQMPVIINALGTTIFVTVTMSMIGAMYPKSLEHWGGWLFAALLSLIGLHIFQFIMVASGGNPYFWKIGLLDYFGAAIFSLLLIFDWNRALRLPYTLKNAFDSAIAIFLDVINLFFIFLRLQSND